MFSISTISSCFSISCTTSIMRLITWPVRSWKSCAIMISSNWALVNAVCSGTRSRYWRVSVTSERASANSIGLANHSSQRPLSVLACDSNSAWRGCAASTQLSARSAACAVMVTT
ncbi:hypothetical protein D3C75_1073890 [compost metagenome]